MAQRNTSGFSDQFDLEQMLVEAQHRWLRTPEICEILRNHKRFNVAPEPPNMPPSGSLFLFDRKVLRYFRKDGHRWRKKKDGNTVKEAHERLKAGSIDVLHCYYAHGEENENFQRRSYWLLEEELSHIVLVHYREVKIHLGSMNPIEPIVDPPLVVYYDSCFSKIGREIRWQIVFISSRANNSGYRTNFNRFKETEQAISNATEIQQIVCNSEAESSINSGIKQVNRQLLCQNADSRSLNSVLSSDYEHVETGVW